MLTKIFLTCFRALNIFVK